MIIRTCFIAFALTLAGCSNVITATQEGPIQEDPKTRTTGSFIDDELIEVKALVNLNKASDTLANAHVSVTSFNGVVLLTGQVPDENTRMMAESTIRQIRKVRTIHNELTISGPTSHIVRTNDAWITSKIKVNMISDKNFNSSVVKVVTENGVVYLLGLVSHADADKAVALVKQSHGVQKIVKMFEYIGQ
ncbi:MAG: BON domain-containing protein [Motiliproteus sp.]|nr:BON domain-containing protein [Motiliproteus sp.]MCW9053644.1 BON domain-containing protein [Motiliproteus sp.]